MSKSDIIAHVAESAGLSKKQATDALDAAVQAIESAIRDCGPGDSVRVPGLGTFTVRERTGRNPRTGATIQIAASRSVGFKAAKSLKDAAAR